MGKLKRRPFSLQKQQPQQEQRKGKGNDEDDDDYLIYTTWTESILKFLLDVIVKALYIVKPVLAVAIAIFILWRLASYTLNNILCPLIPKPFLSLFPPCQYQMTSTTLVPDFSQLLAVQEKLYKTVIDPQKRIPLGSDICLMTSNDINAPISPLTLKQVELATRDLQLMIKYSNLAYKDLLETKLSDYLRHSRAFGRDIQSMLAQGKGVIDNLITYNTVTLRKLSDVEKGITSKQDLRSIYEYAMELIEREARRLILAIEKSQESLNMLEADLYSIHEITIQEKSHQLSEKPHILADLVNMVRGRELQRPIVRKNMELLTSYDMERTRSSQRLMVLLDQMETVQMDLEELRTQIVAPLIVADSLPLEMHIENIDKAIQRLKRGKLTWEDHRSPEFELSSSSSISPSPSLSFSTPSLSSSPSSTE